MYCSPCGILFQCWRTEGYVWGGCLVVCLVWDVSVLFCFVYNGHAVELCADVYSSSVVLIVVIPSCVFGIEVSYYYCIRDVAKLVEVG